MTKPNNDKPENFSLSIDPRLIKFIDLIAHRKFTNRSQIIADAIRVYIKRDRMEQEDRPEWWDKYYQEMFEEAN